MSMDADRWQRVQEILNEALEMSAGERGLYLAEACAGDAELRQEVESLLDASNAADDYFAGLADRAGITQETEPAGDAAAAPGLEGRRIGAYRLGRLLGRGGMGAVYLAERDDGRFELTAALKILPVGAGGVAAHRRLVGESRILARLEHPGIARLLDAGVTEDGTPWFVMEHVRGRPLQDWSREAGTAPEPRLRLFLQVCDAVSYAHRKLVVHRDLKPSNVLVTEAGEVKLLDFGIARLLEEEAGTDPTVGARALTPRYASPEQIRGDPVTTSSDVYALGVILHELLTGRSPYAPGLVGAALEQEILRGSIRPPSALGAPGPADDDLDRRAMAAPSRQLRGDLDTIVLKALRKEPERRYASVDALAEDVRRHLDGYPIRARPERLGYVLSRFVKRHRLGVAAAAVLVALATTLLAVSVRFAVTTSAQARLITVERDKAQAISDFVRELFEVANPALARGDTVTARALLDRGAEQIATHPSADPDLAAEMMTVLGTAYHHLGLPEPALDLLRRARAIQDSASGIPPEHVAETTLRLGIALRDAGLAGEAVPVLRDARDRLEAIHGPEDRSVALAGFALGRALHATGEPMAAEPEFRRAVETFRALRLEPDEEYAQALYLLAEFLQVQGQMDGVEALYRESLDVVERLRGRVSPQVPPILQGLAWVAIRRDEIDKATGFLREAVDIDRRLYGTLDGGNHPSLAQSVFTLGRHLAANGDPEEAEKLLRTAVSMFESASQPRPDMHGTALLALGAHLKDRGDTLEALTRYEDAARIFRQAYGPGSLLEAGALVDRAEILVASGRGSDAVAPLEDALAAYEGVLPATHRRVQQAMELLERARTIRGRQGLSQK